jgi:hypothetical protein
MAPPTIVPDKNTLVRWSEEGLTHQAMADRVYEETGTRVTRTAISAAMARYGMSKDGARYRKTIPWRVKVLHAKAYPVRMLRLLGKRLDGGELNPAENQTLDRWLEMISESKTVVAYDPDSDAGFFYIDRKFKDNRGPAPIRRQPIHVDEPA